MIDSEILRGIFYSGFDVLCDWQTLDELEVLIKEGAINYDKERAFSKDDYFKTLDRIKVIDGLGPQGKGHMALKEIAKNYLEKLNKKALFEFHLVGMHPDVVADDRTMIIECGNTDPAGVLILLVEKNTSFVGVLPYPIDEDKDLVLHKFSRGLNFLDYKDWKLSKLRKTFRRTKK